MDDMDENSINNDQTMRDGGVPAQNTNDLNVSIGNMATGASLADDAALGRVDRYELLEKLGQGGFGAVYRAHDPVSDTEVALKALPPLLAHISDELERVRANF